MEVLNIESDKVKGLLNLNKETLVEMYLEQMKLRKKFENESSWLDQLADLLRDMDDDFEERQQEIREEYEEQEKSNKHFAKDLFVDLEEILHGLDEGTYKGCAFLVNNRKEVYEDFMGIIIYSSLEDAQKDASDNFEGSMKAVLFSALDTGTQWCVIDQIKEDKEEEEN